jgi:molybdenum cofactor cytidylyltransferase
LSVERSAFGVERSDAMSVAPLPPFRFSAVILAAGASVRLGRPKQLLEVDGQPLVARAAAAALSAGAHPVVVVLGANADQIRPALDGSKVAVVLNPSWSEGMASSVRAGLQALAKADPGIDAVLLTVCDQPALSADVIRRLLGALQASGRGIAAARYSGRNGVPALLRREYFFALAKLAGDHGARQLLNGAPEVVATVDLPELALDLDTPGDVERWRQNRCLAL